MVKIRQKTVSTATFKVDVLQKDISEGRCGKISLCMHKIAIERALRHRDPKGSHKVRVDGGNIRFNFQGHRYRALTPPTVKRTLIRFDQERKARAKAEKAGVPYESKVTPHSYRLEAVMGSKVTTVSRERKDQINKARRDRRAAGKPDKAHYDLRYRVEGLAGV